MAMHRRENREDSRWMEGQLSDQGAGLTPDEAEREGRKAGWKWLGLRYRSKRVCYKGHWRVL